MNQLSIEDISIYVEQNIKKFHDSRLQSLEKVDLKKLLTRKNPYLFKVKNFNIAGELVKGILEAHISSSEETIFGDWLEGLAIYINNCVYGGKKSSATGIDLEFENEGVRYLVNIKSGPNWGNSDQIKKMKLNFDAARKTLGTSNSKINVVAVNGCCYGKGSNELKSGNYYKYCGQKFWEFISGEKSLYIDIIEPLGTKAKERNDEFMEKYSALLNKLTLQFSNEFCDKVGKINWPKIVKLNSSYEKTLKERKKTVPKVVGNKKPS
jgi:hypothetical protein